MFVMSCDYYLLVLAVDSGNTNNIYFPYFRRHPRDEALRLSRDPQCLRKKRLLFESEGFASLLASRIHAKQNNIQSEPQPAGRLTPRTRKKKWTLHAVLG